MGSLLLDCPLCCSETFTCHNSLKYHLLSISDNLICPACGKRFEKIFDLAMHLGRQCIDSEQDISTELLAEENIDSKNGEINRDSYERSVSIVELQMKQESDDDQNHTSVGTTLSDSSNNSSILAKALLKDTNTDKKNEAETIENITGENELETNEDQQLQEEEDLYYCSSCAINFTSVEEHLKKFHEGHEVYVEESNDDSINVENVAVLMSDPEDEDFCDNDEYDNESKDILKAIKSAELLNTVQEEERVDKNGRVYTRRVVKIEKFWDDKEDRSKDNLDVENSLETPKINTVQEDVTPENVEADAGDTEEATHEVLEFYQCSSCAKKFATIEHYSKHKCSGVPEENNKFEKCKICKACFVNAEYLEAHMKIHKRKSTTSVTIDPNPPFICKICNTEFTTYKSLRLHRRMHEPIKSKDIEPPVSYGMLGEELGEETVPREFFICQICNKPYNKEYEEAHAKFHSKELDYNCDICNRKFYTQENLTMHIRAHTDHKKFTCSYCKKGFLTNEKLEAHMSTKCQKRRYECQYCGRRFARPHEKVKHERIHTGEKPHVCEICGKSFRVSYCLTLHMRTHSGTRPYKCDHCGKRFKAHSVYNHHLLTHSEDRKYKCPYCPKTFKTGVQLAGHKNSHTKPFTCTECNRPFASLYAVRAHMETHQRQNNLKYRCWICGASYARAFALRDHVREQHVSDRDNNVDADAIILETDDYPITENIEASEPILGDADESMLIDIGTEDVGNIELPTVQVDTDVQDNSNT